MSPTVWCHEETNSLGILYTFKDGFRRFEIEWKSGPVNGHPREWDGTWVFVGWL